MPREEKDIFLCLLETIFHTFSYGLSFKENLRKGKHKSDRDVEKDPSGCYDHQTYQPMLTFPIIHDKIRDNNLVEVVDF